MKVLHIISSGGVYGAEAIILNLSRALHEGTHRSTLGVFSNSAHLNSQLQERAVEEGIETHLIPCKGQLDRSVPNTIRTLVSATNVDVVHAHGYKADVYAYVALRNTPTPLISTCHTWYDNDVAVRLYGALDRHILRKYAGVVAVSEDVRKRLIASGVQPDRIRFIRNGIDLTPFASNSSSRNDSKDASILSVGLVGRLAPEKGVDLFLRAAALVLAELPQARFSVVGDGPHQAQLEALIHELNIEGSVALLGRKDDMLGFYSSLDLLVSASRQEGLPVALLEGMASWLPVIATSVGAVPSVVQDGRTGLLVASEDVHALAQGMLQLLRDPDSRRLFGVAARQVVAEDFSAARMASEYLSFYEAIIHERSKGTVQ